MAEKQPAKKTTAKKATAKKAAAPEATSVVPPADGPDDDRSGAQRAREDVADAPHKANPEPATKPEHQGKEAEGEVSPPPPVTSSPNLGDGSPGKLSTAPHAPSVHPQTTEGVTRKAAQAAAKDHPQGLARVERDREAAEARRDGRPVPVDQDIQARSLAAPLDAPETRPGVRTEKREEMPHTEAVDTTAAAAGVMSLAGQTSGGLYDEDGNKITGSSGLFEEIGDGTLCQVTKRIEEEFTPRNAITPTRRLIFAAGQTVTRTEAARFTRHLDG